MVDTDEERTPLQQKLDEFAQQLSKYGLSILATSMIQSMGARG